MNKYVRPKDTCLDLVYFMIEYSTYN